VVLAEQKACRYLAIIIDNSGSSTVGHHFISVDEGEVRRVLDTWNKVATHPRVQVNGESERRPLELRRTFPCPTHISAFYFLPSSTSYKYAIQTSPKNL